MKLVLLPLFALRDDGLKLVRLLPGPKQSKWELAWDLPHLASIEWPQTGHVP